jgi:type VI secretion system protein ImpH
MRDPLATLARLEADAGRFDFHAALRLIECAFPAQPRIGESQRPRDDAVRFGQRASLAFTADAIASFERAEGQTAPRLAVNFFGLFGANGPLPLHLTEYVRDRERNAADPTLARFADIFHHRLIALFHRAWAHAQPAVSLDRPEADRFSTYVGSTFGIGEPALRERDEVPDFAKLHYAGRLAAQARNAEGLAAILSDFFRVPVAVQQFIGHWMELPDDGFCRLQSRPDGQRLGVTTVLGRRIWNAQHKFRVVVGPLAIDDFRRMLPGGASLRRLADWVRNYAGLAYRWDLRLVLRREDVPPLRLGRDARLGWTTWLASRPAREDDGQLLLDPLRAGRLPAPAA